MSEQAVSILENGNITPKIMLALNCISDDINKLYGYVDLGGENYGEPSINSGPCGPFALLMYNTWNSLFKEKVVISFVLDIQTEECWHIVIRLPDGSLYDGGVGVHSDDSYSDKFKIEDMTTFDLARMEKNSNGLNRAYPRFCPKFNVDDCKKIIRKHLAIESVGLD